MPSGEGLRAAFERDGFAVLPGRVPAAELEPALAQLGALFPTADEFHDDIDPARNQPFRSEFGGILAFPFPSVEWSLLAVHPALVAVAEEVLGTSDLRVYSLEAWAKYTGAADYDQPHHRDYLNQTLLVPRHWPPDCVELFLYLSDVPLSCGPTRLAPRSVTSGMPALPNWYPRDDGPGDPERPGWWEERGRPDLYEHEVAAVGPAGTVVAYGIATFHRGSAMTEPRGARFTIHAAIRRADSDWTGRRAWVERANTEAWREFVARATPRQLALFGFPPPGHPFWTDEARAGLAQRYPGVDPDRWLG